MGVWVVTGGASGFGAAVARRAVVDGHQVVLADVQEGLGQALAEELSPHAAFSRCDVRSEEDVMRAVQTAEERFGPLTVMVANAGIYGATTSIDQMNTAEYVETLRINLVGVFLSIKHAARAMKARGTKGAIVSLSSVAGCRGGFAPAGYTSAKFGVVALTQQAACELAPHGIRVNCISPGAADTPMVRILLTGAADGDVSAVLGGGSPLAGRMLTAEDIANSIAFLASEQSGAITGHNLVLDLGTLLGYAGKPLGDFEGTRSPMLQEAGKMGINKDQGTWQPVGPGRLADAGKTE